jgi:hypothetical protein
MIDDDADFQFSAVAKYAIVLLQKSSHLVISYRLVYKPRQIFIIFAIILVTLLMNQLSQRTEALPTADLQSDLFVFQSSVGNSNFPGVYQKVRRLAKTMQKGIAGC